MIETFAGIVNGRTDQLSPSDLIVISYPLNPFHPSVLIFNLSNSVFPFSSPEGISKPQTVALNSRRCLNFH